MSLNKKLDNNFKLRGERMNINVISNQGKDNTLDPAYFQNSVRMRPDDKQKGDIKIYGFKINPNEADPYERVLYLKDAINMTPASMSSTSFSYGSWEDVFFKPRPCMLKSNCHVDYYLNPNDYSKKIDGSPSDITNPNYDGNAMMEWDLLWFKFEKNEETNEGLFLISNEQIDETYDCPCNRDANGDIIPHFYTAIYNGTGGNKLRSLSGVQLTNENGNGGTTGREDVDRAVANNTTNDIEWYMHVWCDRLLINALLVLISHSTDTQSRFGRGIDNNKDTETAQALKESYITGSMDTRGLFFGDIKDGYSPVKVFGMENWWGCVWSRTAGLRGSPDGYKYQLTQPYHISGSSYNEVKLTRPYSGDISQCIFGDFGILPLATQGSTSTYYADTYHDGTGYALTGDCSGSGHNCGAFALGLHGVFSEVSWSVSTTLSCKPMAYRFK